MPVQFSSMLADELKLVPHELLEDYVQGRIREFACVFAEELVGAEAAASPAAATAWQTAAVRVSAARISEASTPDALLLRFVHTCKFRGCTSKECVLCINNPNKECGDVEFGDAFADNQILRSPCDADVHVQLTSQATGQPVAMNGVEVLLSIVDGEAAVGSGNDRELLHSDEGQPLLGAHLTSTRRDDFGRLLLPLTSGSSRLPDLYVTDKNDTFHMGGSTYGSFRLLATAVQRDAYGHAVPLACAQPAVSCRFAIKTQRALNDYRKAEYPHFRDELTKLKFIGSVTAQRLRDIQAHMPGVPFESIDSVDELRHLMLYADQHRQVETKLLELLNMKGKHIHKWEYLRSMLQEKVVFDDAHPRAWFADAAKTSGLVFPTKQGQVHIDKPCGLAQMATRDDGSAYMQVLSSPDAACVETARVLRAAAEEAWGKVGHPGWVVVTEPLELVTSPGEGSTAMAPLGGMARMGSSAAKMLDLHDFFKVEPRAGGGVARGASATGERKARLHKTLSQGNAAPSSGQAFGPGSEPGRRPSGGASFLSAPSSSSHANASDPLPEPMFGSVLNSMFTFGTVMGTGGHGVAGPSHARASRTSAPSGGGHHRVYRGSGGGAAALPERLIMSSTGASLCGPTGGAEWQPASASLPLPPALGMVHGASAPMRGCGQLSAPLHAAPPSPAEGAWRCAPHSFAADALPDFGRALAHHASFHDAGAPDLAGFAAASLAGFDAAGACELSHRRVSTELAMPSRTVSTGITPVLGSLGVAAAAAGSAYHAPGSSETLQSKRSRDPPPPFTGGLGACAPLLTSLAPARGVAFFGIDETETGPPVLSDVQLYHSESKGRHVPRPRASHTGEAPSDDDLNDDDMDDFLRDLATGDLVGVQGLSLASPVGEQYGQCGVRTVSPTGLLSSNMQHVLHLDGPTHAQQEQQQQQQGVGEPSSHLSGGLPPEGGEAPSHLRFIHNPRQPGQPSALFPDSNSDSFNRTLNTLLRRTGSDSFRHMLDAIPGNESPAASSGMPSLLGALPSLLSSRRNDLGDEEAFGAFLNTLDEEALAVVEGG
ncbi:hypothetical protein FOA52_007356 [Chlamydomonas sp. UWO 241]|nr:hypothetical protein FOA52_007356 [Chlamydomonas sp. UWO 241]